MANLVFSKNVSVDYSSVNRMNCDSLVVGDIGVVIKDWLVPNIDLARLSESIIVDYGYRAFRATKDYITPFMFNPLVLDANSDNSIKFNPFMVNAFVNAEEGVKNLSSLLLKMFYKDSDDEESAFLTTVIFYISCLLGKEERNFKKLKNILENFSLHSDIRDNMQNYVAYKPNGLLVYVANVYLSLTDDELERISSIFLQKLNSLFVDKIYEVTSIAEPTNYSHISNPVIYVENSGDETSKIVSSLFINFYYDVVLGSRSNRAWLPHYNLYIGADNVVLPPDFSERMERVNILGFVTCVYTSDVANDIYDLISKVAYVIAFKGATKEAYELVSSFTKRHFDAIVQELMNMRVFIFSRYEMDCLTDEYIIEY